MDDPRMNDRLRSARLLAVAALGFVLFSYPFLELSSRDVLVVGIPVLWVYLFAAWGLVIALVAWIVRR
jgi:hypothetical protein